MKRLFGLSILNLLPFCLYASTSITTATVSGHWVAAGSPYKIYNNIEVAAGTALTIDAGVDIVFQGMYNMRINGVLSAKGSPSQPINFHIQDTTSWSNSLTMTGGWQGLYFNVHSGSIDSSAFEFCNVYDTKGSMQNSFYTARNITIKSCNFFHNKCDNEIIAANANVDLINCNINDNLSAKAIVRFTLGHTSKITGSNVYNNISNANIIDQVPGTTLNLLIENCNIYQNQSTELGKYGSTINIYGGNVIIRKNKIHHNTNAQEAAVFSWFGIVDINSNLICNNSNPVAVYCGAVEGGGGISLKGNSALTSVYTVRNNIIANNYSNLFAGGIFLIECGATIINNTIINNSSRSPLGPGIYIPSGSHPSVIKNNIIHSNVSVGFADIPNVYSAAMYPVEFVHNWCQRPFYKDFSLWPGGATTTLGDTATNIAGTNLDLVSPTHTTLYTDNAVTANFDLLPTSWCINTGDTSGINPDTTDYGGNHRLTGSNIDIGAYEFHSFCPDTIVGVTALCAGTTVSLSHPVSGGIWSSPQSPAVVTINPITGVVTGVGGGVATIYYKTGGCLASVNLHVYSLPDSIFGSPHTCIGTNTFLSSPPGGGIWSASNANALVTPIGMVTGISVGIDTIFYSVSNMCGSKTITMALTVNPSPSPVTGPSVVCSGDSIALTNSGGGIWSTPDYGIVSLGYTTGVVTGLAQGTATIIYTIPATGCSVPHFITVNPTPAAINGVFTVCKGTSENLTDLLGGGIWSTADAAIASIDSITGVVTGNSVGIVVITYKTHEGCFTTRSEDVILCPEGLPEISQHETMCVFPNPANNILFISLQAAEGTVALVDITGKLITAKKVNSALTSFDIHSIPHGIYFAVWFESTGAKTTQKVIVE